MNGKLTRATEIDRVSELLGLPEKVNDSASLTTEIRKGFPVESVEKVLKVLGSKPALNIISDRAYRRAKSEKRPISAANSQVLFDVARAYVVADRIHHGNGALVMQFFEKPCQDFGGAAAMALTISSPAGADAVTDFLNR
jgi:putative toxin-antitoxin system antitoxin component (TIGR02293 family)